MSTEIDFTEIRNSLKEFLRSQDELQDYDFDGSAISSIIDLLAYTTHINAVNANVGLNETFLDTAQFRGSVVGHARQLGYIPRSATAATAAISIQVNNAIEDDFTLDRGHPFRATINGETLTFFTLQNFTPDDNGFFENVRVFQGTFKASEFIFDVRSGERFIIQDEDVDISTLQVRVFDNADKINSRVFNQAKELTSIKLDSDVYFIAENPDGRYEIFFGDGVLGTALEDGNLIRIEYLKTKKADANGARTFSTTTPIGGTTNISISTLSPAQGGEEKESTESVRRNAPLTFASQNRVVVPQDFEAVIRESFGDLESISVWGGEDNDPPVYGKAFLSIKPKSSDILSDDQKEFILNEILKPKSVLTVEPEILDPDFLFIALEVFFKFNPALTDLTTTQLEQKVVQKIRDFNTENLRRFGRVFRYSNVLNVIDTADNSIINSFARVYLARRFIPRIGIPTTYTLDYSVDLFESFGARPVIFRSSRFTVNGLANCRFTDVPRQDGTRRIQIVRGETQSPTVVVRDAGFIKGTRVVLTRFNPEAIEGSVIGIEVIPNSYNIFGKRNTLLTIDCNCERFSIEGTVDTFATGQEFSGIGYEVTSKNA